MTATIEETPVPTDKLNSNFMFSLNLQSTNDLLLFLVNATMTLGMDVVFGLRIQSTNSAGSASTYLHMYKGTSLLQKLQETLTKDATFQASLGIELIADF